MDDTRDKVVALEVRVEELGKKLDSLTESVDRLTDLLAQAKGAKWAVGMLLVAAGAASTYLPTALRLLIGKA